MPCLLWRLATLTWLVHAVVACVDGTPAGGAPTVMAERHPDRPLPAGAEIRRDPERDTIRFLEGENLSASLDDDTTFREHQASDRFDELALAFVASHRSSFRLRHPADELSVRSVTSDDLGLTHVKLQQEFRDLPIWEAELIVHLNAANQVTLVNGRYVPTPSGLRTTPGLGADDARRIVGRQLPRLDGPCRECPSTLGIFAPESGAPRLAYRVRATVSLAEAWQFTVDAENGNVLQKLPTVLRAIPFESPR